MEKNFNSIMDMERYSPVQYCKKHERAGEKMIEDKLDQLPSTLAGHASVHALSSRSCWDPLGGGGSLRKGSGPSPTCISVSASVTVRMGVGGRDLHDVMI